MSSQAQTLFNSTFISSREIRERMGVERSSVTIAIRNRILPEPVLIDGRTNIYLWMRTEVEPQLEKWKNSIAFKRERKDK